jgi:hypothetical protein
MGGSAFKNFIGLASETFTFYICTIMQPHIIINIKLGERLSSTVH